MTKARLISLLCSFLLGVTCVSAQVHIISREKLDSVSNPKLAPDASALEFDTMHIKAEPMNEDDRPESFVYTFRNVSDRTLNINRVVSTCSCAPARCDKEALGPGETAKVTVTYHPKGHPGSFQRRIFLYTDDNRQPSAILKLSVKVSSSPDRSAQYPADMGKVRFRSREVRVRQDVRSVERLVFINVSDSPLSLRCEDMLLPGCLEFRTEPETVEPDCEGQVVITFDPSEYKPGRKELQVILKDLGLPPSQSSIKVIVK